METNSQPKKPIFGNLSAIFLIVLWVLITIGVYLTYKLAQWDRSWAGHTLKFNEVSIWLIIWILLTCLMWYLVYLINKYKN